MKEPYCDIQNKFFQPKNTEFELLCSWVELSGLLNTVAAHAYLTPWYCTDSAFIGELDTSFFRVHWIFLMEQSSTQN